MTSEVLEKLVKYYHENKISHAYLLETNNVDACFNDLKLLVKQIFCQDKYYDGCSKCNICNLVDQGFLPSFVVIEPDGASIKKEQIVELKRQFSTIPLYTKENIYVIKEAERLNGSSANTMLKFLEEPDANILGFFITNNANNVISTIKSRCEVLKVYYETDKLDINKLGNEEYKEKLEVAINYLYKLEVEKNYFLMYNRDIVLNKFKEREDIKIIFKIILLIYEELFNGGNSNLIQRLEGISLEKEELLRRIKMVIELLDNLDCNGNIELLLDKFVIELGD